MRFSALIFLFCLLPVGLFSQSDLSRWDSLLKDSGYVDNWPVRLDLQDRITAPPLILKEMPMEIFSTADPRLPAVKFEFRDQNNAHYILLVNQNDHSHFFNEQVRYQVDLLGRGNWIIRRNPLDGSIEQAKIFLSYFDENSYIRISAGSDRSYLDLILMGRTLYRHIPLGISMEQVVVSPFSRILDLSSDAIDWKEIFPDAGFEEWGEVEKVSQQITSLMDSFTYSEDGAIDHSGRWVTIEDGTQQVGNAGFNCSGFSKWVADGFYLEAPFGSKMGEMLDINLLKDEKAEMLLRGENSWLNNYEDRDPLFGLIWTRNIALQLWQSFSGIEGRYGAQDLKQVPFFEYKKDIGYPLSDLESLVYLAAVKNPGQVYWCTINSDFPLTPVEGMVTLWQYHHVFVLLPWFDRQGNFHYKIFDSFGLEKGESTALEFLINRYPGDSWVHLSTTPAWLGFNPTAP